MFELSKQDRQGARTATDIQRRYGTKFSEIMGYAEDVKQEAEQAEEKVNQLDDKLDQKEIFLRLTNNGKVQGLFLGDDGELYINASYIAAGVLSSQDGTLQIDLSKGTFSVGNLFEFNASGLVGFGETETGEHVKTLGIYPGCPTVGHSMSAEQTKNAASKIYSYDCDLQISAGAFREMYPKYAVRIGYADYAKVVIKDKTVDWYDVGNGRYYLVSTDE